MGDARIELLAVDLDGTLVDSAPDIAHCLDEALVAVGYPAPGEARTRSWIGDGLEMLIARALAHAIGTSSAANRKPGRSGNDDLHRTALTAFLEHYASNLFVRSRLYPGVEPTLDAFRARGVRLCCITNKRHAFADPLLTQAGIRDRFELVLGGDSLAAKKPNPLPLEVAASTLGVEPRAATLVGDSHQDLGAARSAGYGFVFAAYGYGKVGDELLGPYARIARFDELRSVLDL